MDLHRWKMFSAAAVLLLATPACRKDEPAVTQQAAPPAVTQQQAAPVPAAEPTKAAPPVDPAVVERGRYLSEAVLACGMCHTARDTTRFGGPESGPALAGACFGEEWGVPGRVCAPNITSDPEHGIGSWTDAELLSALREGKGRDGRTLFPMMPYVEWRALSDEDARAVVAHLRQVPPVKSSVQRSEVPDEVYADIKDLAEPLPGPVPGPGGDAVERGRYLATIAQCAFCHAGMGEPPAPFAGGRPAPTPQGDEVVPSLLPKGPVLRGLSEDAFVARFTAFKDLAPAPARKGQVNKLAMPWAAFARMHEDDLRAVYRYLRTQGAPAAKSSRRGD